MIAVLSARVHKAETTIELVRQALQEAGAALWVLDQLGVLDQANEQRVRDIGWQIQELRRLFVELRTHLPPLDDLRQAPTQPRSELTSQHEPPNACPPEKPAPT